MKTSIIINLKHSFFLILFVSFLINTEAKSDTNLRFKTYIESADLNNKLNLQQYNKLKLFYFQNNYTLKWYARTTDSSKRNELKHLIENAALFALNQSDFHHSFLALNTTSHNIEDTFAAEVRFTDAALSFMHNLAYGGNEGFVKFNGINYHPDNLDLASILAAALMKDNLIIHLTTVEPTGEKFNFLKQEYLRLLMLSKEKDFKEITVTSKDVKKSNINLAGKLRQLAYLAEADTTQNGLQAALHSLQKHHLLIPQKIINSLCLAVLNETIAHKLQELRWNIKWYRWLNGMKDKSYLVVNIPSNTLTYYENGMTKLESKMVVGKLSTPTPTLTSEIKNVIYYPYWNVPHSIAVKEMLPKLKRNPGYLYNQKIEVLRNGRVVTGINWHSFSSSNFPFQLRQKTGCHNALGLLKFDFENPFHVYLHDTNAKTAFYSSKRFFSHGCMRVEKPYELAVALGVPAGKLDMKSCLQNKRPETIPLLKPVPLFVIYATIDVTDGQLYWYEDAYRKIAAK